MSCSLSQGKGQRAEGKGKAKGKKAEDAARARLFRFATYSLSPLTSPLPSAPCPLPFLAPQVIPQDGDDAEEQ